MCALPRLEFAAGEPVQVNVSALLQLARIDLEAENVDSGGLGPFESEDGSYSQGWPSYRQGTELHRSRE